MGVSILNFKGQFGTEFILCSFDWHDNENYPRVKHERINWIKDAILSSVQCIWEKNNATNEVRKFASEWQAQGFFHNYNLFRSKPKKESEIFKSNSTKSYKEEENLKY